MTTIQITWQGATLELTGYEISAYRRSNGTVNPQRCMLYFLDRSWPFFNAQGLFRDEARDTGLPFWRNDRAHCAHPLLREYSHALPVPRATLVNYLTHCGERGETAGVTADQFEYIRRNFKQVPVTVPGRLHCAAMAPALSAPIICIPEPVSAKSLITMPLRGVAVPADELMPLLGLT